PTLASCRAGASPMKRARSSCRSQRRLSMSQSMSLANAASPDTVIAGRSPATTRVRASAGLAASTATRRSGGNDEASGSHSTSPPEVLRRLAALGADVSHFVRADVRDRAALDTLFGGGRIDAVVHFAASKAVGESVAEPLKYYANNVGGLIALAEAMQAHGC